jgi:hypothetical protein
MLDESHIPYYIMRQLIQNDKYVNKILEPFFKELHFPQHKL